MAVGHVTPRPMEGAHCLLLVHDVIISIVLDTSGIAAVGGSSGRVGAKQQLVPAKHIV